jgi:hypothetical protein
MIFFVVGGTGVVVIADGGGVSGVAVDGERVGARVVVVVVVVVTIVVVGGTNVVVVDVVVDVVSWTKRDASEQTS